MTSKERTGAVPQAQERQQPAEARKRPSRSPSQASEGTKRTTPCSQASGLQNYERIHFCCESHSLRHYRPSDLTGLHRGSHRKTTTAACSCAAPPVTLPCGSYASCLTQGERPRQHMGFSDGDSLAELHLEAVKLFPRSLRSRNGSQPSGRPSPNMTPLGSCPCLCRKDRARPPQGPALTTPPEWPCEAEAPRLRLSCCCCFKKIHEAPQLHLLTRRQQPLR